MAVTLKTQDRKISRNQTQPLLNS